MTGDRLDALLAALDRGDDNAASELFLQCEPYLRMVVRRRLTPRLRSKFDSCDVVQSVWADVLGTLRQPDGRFPDVAHLRAFLTRATYNRFIDRLRQNRRALERETLLDERVAEALPPAKQPSPSEVAEAGELWEELLALCPPERRELLELKRQGLRLAEIAERTGLHEGSVRRILYELARRLAARRAEDERDTE